MLGFKLVHLFNKFEVQYLTCGGTLLGQIRGKQLIKHDYDLDYDLLDAVKGFEHMSYMQENEKVRNEIEMGVIGFLGMGSE